MQADFVIIGAGVLGLSLAWHLTRLGASCVLVERETSAGQHASSKNAGMFRQLYRQPQLSNWAKRSPDLWPEEMRAQHFRQTGSYVVGRHAPGHHSELFQERSLFLSGPTGSRTLPAVYTPTDGLLDSVACMSLLPNLLPSSHCSFLPSTQAIQAEWQQGFWKIQTQGEEIQASQLVNACGAWAPGLVLRNQHEDLQLPAKALQPFARFLYLLSGWPTGYMPEANCGFYWNEADEWYLRAWNAEQRLVSICDQLASDPDNFHPGPTPTEVLKQTLTNAFPDFAQKLQIQTSWHCFRTYTSDQLPVWGPDPRQDNLSWLVGFGGFGMSTAFAATYDLAQLLSGRQTQVSPAVSINRLLTTNQHRAS